MICKNCGAELDEGAMFCGNCGMRVEQEKPVYEVPAQETNNEYQEQGSYEPPVMPEYSSEPAYVPVEKPNTVLWIVLAAVEIFSCCQITGIVSLIYAILGHVSAEKGDFADAENKIRTAKIWFWVGFGLGLFFIIAYFALVAIGVAASITEGLLYY